MMMKMSKITYEKTSYVNQKKSTYEFIQEKFVSLLQIVNLRVRQILYL